MAILGKNFVVSWDASGELLPIAGGRTDEIQTDCDIIKVSSPNDGEWEHSIAGRKSWSISVGWLMVNGGDNNNLLRVGETYEISFAPQSGTTGFGVTGYAILKTCRITATLGNLIQGSFQFVGVGALDAS
jgi:hypothetical protein